MNADNVIQVAIGLVALAAFYVSIYSAKRADKSVRAAAFERRMSIYNDASEYLRLWQQSGTPDIGQLRLIVRAWDESHFLFSQTVTDYLRQIWLDSIEAAQGQDVITGDADGDKSKAIKRKYELLVQTASYDKLRAVFLPEMKI